MPGDHKEKFRLNLLLGFLFIITSILFIFFFIFENNNEGDWYFWGIVAALLMCLGIYYSLQAFVHKVKSDFSRRQKHKENHEPGTGN